MLLNVSYNNKEISRKIDSAVGKPFTLRKRWALQGIGSPKLWILSSSSEIRNLLILDNNLDSCNIELRPGGIILRFRSLLETYALVIPFHKLSVRKGGHATYSVFIDHYFVKVRADTQAVSLFFKKVLKYKTTHSSQTSKDL